VTRYSLGLRRPAGIFHVQVGVGEDIPVWPVCGTRDREPQASRQSGRLARCAAPSLKSIRAGATDATIKHQLRAAQGQAPNVVIDARSSGLDENSASLGLRRFLGSPWAQGRYTTILILGDDYMIETASPEGAAQ
jgi:hypothetical protein